ncbi:MAG: ACP S-malonyltransferase [Sorangiineae bacterium]|nr:ACP S-malonyltransferase [Polyangiaceae bacterium]MEB2322074.1 ACP S-malonyltransferase [Sorangiineae bacterium]
MGEIAVVFPGQGSQRAGMAQDFHEAFAAAREVFAEASEALSLDVAELCFAGDPRLDLTEFTQPAIVTAEIAMLRAISSEWGLAPTRFGGHSLGEYTALSAAGVMTLADVLRLTRARGALMQDAVPVGEGAMSAVIAAGVADAGVAALVAALGVDVANLNSLDQVVISGPTAGVEAAEKRIAEALPSAEVIRLNVSAPFHSRLMKGIEPAFRAELERAAGRMDAARATRVTSNFTGGFHSESLPSVLDALTAQISGSVNWVANMRVLADGAERIVEIGPNRPLKRFFGTLGVEITSIMNVKTAKKGLEG